MLESLASNKPNTDQRKQLITVAIVKGNGMLTADFVCKTTLRADNGEPNNAMQNRTARFPINSTFPSALDGTFVANKASFGVTAKKLAKQVIAATPCTCCLNVPGKVDDFNGAYFINLTK